MSRALIIGLVSAALGAYLAEKKGRNWLFWGLICAGFPLAIIALLLLPPVFPNAEVRQCPSCGMPNRSGNPACGHCGKTMPIEMVKCPSCGKYVPEGSHCSECGARLG